MRLIGRYLDGSILFSLPGFVVGTIFALFHFFWEVSPFKTLVYIAVISLGNLLNVRGKILLVIPSIAGAFLPLKLSIICFISP